MGRRRRGQGSENAGKGEPALSTNNTVAMEYRQVVDDPVVVVLFFDDRFERLHVVGLEVLHAQNVAKLVLLHEELRATNE